MCRCLLVPLTLCFAAGRPEPLELMLGAGFPGNGKDPEGNTPLHCTVLCKDDQEAAALCAASLCVKYSKLWKVYDSNGWTALHIAAKADRVQIVQVLLQYNVDMGFRTVQGRTVQEVAQDVGAQRVLSLINSHNPTSNTQTHGSRNSKHIDNKYCPKPPGQDMDRIMQVWDKFFENAFLMAEQREQERIAAKNKRTKPRMDDDYREYYANLRGIEDDFDMYAGRGTSTSSSRSQKQKQKTKGSVDRHESKEEYGWVASSGTRKVHASVEEEFTPIMQQQGSTDADAAYYEALEWFNYILCYDSSSTGAGGDCYYVVHKGSHIKLWLADYISHLQDAASWVQYLFLVHDVDTLGSYALPGNMYDCAALGWMAYYDAACNSCCWRQIHTFAAQNYLPLGQDKDGGYSDQDTLISLGLTPYEEGSEWVAADQACALSWVLVIISEEDSRRSRSSKKRDHKGSDCMSGEYYYFNLITSESSWAAPGSDADHPDGGEVWTKQLADWGSWRMCCMEDNPEEIFW